MSLNESIASEIQKLDPSSVIELFELDSTSLGGDIFRFHNGTNKLSQNIVWQGNEYIRFPIQVTGFETSGQGQFPRPTVSVSNVMSAITTILIQYGDLIGSKFTRKRTMLKYLDAVNFPGGVNPDADPDASMADDVFYIDRKALEDRDQVHFELSSAADLQGVKIPQRVITKNICPWIYRGPECGFTGIPLYDENDNPIPAPTSPEAISMMAAWNTLQSDLAILASAQATLSTASATLTAAQKYTQEVHYEKNNSPLYYVAEYSIFGTVKAYWNDALVSLGTTYTRGAWKEFGFTDFIGSGDFYEIVKNTRDEAAVTAAQTAYNTALTNRNTAQSNVDTAQSNFDTALAAVPLDDEVYQNDICGKRLHSCKLRFGATNPLTYGGFPGVSQ